MSDPRLMSVADATRSLGATLRGRSVGTLADLTVLSLHPAKIMTTGEGGAVLTDDDARAERLRGFRIHGIATELAARRDWTYAWSSVAEAGLELVCLLRGWHDPGCWSTLRKLYQRSGGHAQRRPRKTCSLPSSRSWWGVPGPRIPGPAATTPGSRPTAASQRICIGQAPAIVPPIRSIRDDGAPARTHARTVTG